MARKRMTRKATPKIRKRKAYAIDDGYVYVIHTHTKEIRDLRELCTEKFDAFQESLTAISDSIAPLKVRLGILWASVGAVATAIIASAAKHYL